MRSAYVHKVLRYYHRYYALSIGQQEEVRKTDPPSRRLYLAPLHLALTRHGFCLVRGAKVVALDGGRQPRLLRRAQALYPIGGPLNTAHLAGVREAAPGADEPERDLA